MRFHNALLYQYMLGEALASSSLKKRRREIPQHNQTLRLVNSWKTRTLQQWQSEIAEALTPWIRAISSGG